MKVYLAGTISKDPEHLRWREHLTETFKNTNHTIVSPMRFQDPKHFTKGGLHDNTTPDSFFVAVDYRDVSEADVVFLVFWKGDYEARYLCRQSVGTWSEFGIATFLHTPVIVVTDDPDVFDHPFIKRKAAIIVSTVEEGLEWLRKILT